jgi:hypothetical protein
MDRHALAILLILLGACVILSPPLLLHFGLWYEFCYWFIPTCGSGDTSGLATLIVGIGSGLLLASLIVIIGGGD